ncbi:MAG: 50S ribosomal protein L6 [Anaerovoracaceae bacterium]
MSRIGIKPINLPAGVELKVEKDIVTVKGPKGELQERIFKKLKVEQADGIVNISRGSETKEEKSQHGLARTLVSNMVTGVSDGFEKKLEIQGVGYKAEKKGNKLVLSLGYSHLVEMDDPDGITTEVPSTTEIVVKGAEKAKVGNYAANIRAWRKPEPYKGKGIRYAGEQVRRKEGKSGIKAGE